MKSINGITLVKHNESILCYIDDFSDELKSQLKALLSFICHGRSKSESVAMQYSYKATLKEFCERYDKKNEDTQKGMIGELLAHIIFNTYLDDFAVISPYFNMEEASIKKGFDVVLYLTNCNECWYTEVKSGEIRKNTKNNNDAARKLLTDAKKGIMGSLNSQRGTLWHNAVNNATLSYRKHGKILDAVLDIIEYHSELSCQKNMNASIANVILVSSLFSDITDKVRHSTLDDFLNDVKSKSIFNNVIVLSIQKNTYYKVINFLRSECA